MKSVDTDVSRYQAGRRIANDDEGRLTPQIGLRWCVDGDRLMVDGKITSDLIFRDGFGGRYME